MNQDKVTLTIEGYEGTTQTISFATDPCSEIHQALLYDIIPVARALLHVPEDDVWTFGTPDE